MSPGARTSEDFRSTRGFAQYCQPNARRSKPWLRGRGHRTGSGRRGLDLSDDPRLRTAATSVLLATSRDQLKVEAVGEIEAGLALKSTDVAEAMVQHGQLLERVADSRKSTSSFSAR